MPYIKKIEVNGFKTFGRKTTLSLDKGFTAITGPNGSGKTNIIDAVLFVLGELSARRLRASNFSSLIFHGSPNPELRKKTKAKVIVQFDNSDGRFPTETVTVSLSREIDRDGQSIYRINGRRVSRTYALDTLSMAGISPHGHNVILQGTLTRMAEVSANERRKIIENMIGISQYEAEKGDAEEKLESAKISIKTAMGQVGEVQKRIEALEKERNNLLRYNYIKKEIDYLEATKLSSGVKKAQNEVNNLNKAIADLKDRIDKIKNQRDLLRDLRRTVETEWRRLGFEEREENQSRVFKIQIQIGEIQSKLSELTSKINTGKTTLDNLFQVRKTTNEQVVMIRKEIVDAENKINFLATSRDEIVKRLAFKKSEYANLSRESSLVGENLEVKTKKIDEMEKQLEQLRQASILIKSRNAEINSRIDVYSERSRNLVSRRKNMVTFIKRLEDSLKELQTIQTEQKKRFISLEDNFGRKSKRKRTLKVEIKEAGKIAQIAKEALIEFDARSELVNKFRIEEKALNHIEELGKKDIIQGVHGRLRKLIKIKRGYKRAIEAASTGWLDALIVKDLDVAFTCFETLRRLKLGRIKIIPLSSNTQNSQVVISNIDGAETPIIDFVQYPEKYRFAVRFVLGDTLLAKNKKAALIASKRRLRSVTRSGDLYEIGGGFISGFYRAPTDFSSFVPSETALNSLNRVVKVLNVNLSRRETDIEEIDSEMVEANNDIVHLAETLAKLDNEIKRTDSTIHQSKLNMAHARQNVTSLENTIVKEREQLGVYEKKQERISEEENELKNEYESLRKTLDIVETQEREKKRRTLGNDIVALGQNVSDIGAELSTFQSRVDEVLRINLRNAFSQLNDASSQIAKIENSLDEAIKDKQSHQIEIENLTRKKEELSSSLLNIKTETKKFSKQIDEIDKKIQILDENYDRKDSLLDEMNLNLQTYHLKIKGQIEQLKTLGYKKPLELPSRPIAETVTSLNLVIQELDNIGAVNQLAQVQYEDQISRYKELSIRMNELEKERMAIVNFINEIEQKKYNAFMTAFNSTNERIDKYFSKLTGGGNSALKLEKPEDPFSGGVDMVVQFIGKPPILVNGASSGERSVSAVAFLFALQEFNPATFYLMDEIDAHLDAFHVEKLGELLADEASKAQFVVVTLKPEMVGKADRIYGVYGREGVSHIVSTSFKGVRK